MSLPLERDRGSRGAEGGGVGSEAMVPDFRINSNIGAELTEFLHRGTEVQLKKILGGKGWVHLRKKDPSLDNRTLLFGLPKSAYQRMERPRKGRARSFIPLRGGRGGKNSLLAEASTAWSKAAGL